MDIIVVTLVKEQMSPWKGLVEGGRRWEELGVRKTKVVTRWGGGCFMAKGLYVVTKMGDGDACGDVMEMIGARSYVMQCTLPIQGIRSIISMVSIRPEGFMPSILLLIVAIVIVVVTVILVVVVVTIVRVVIVVAIVGVVVAGGVSLGLVFLLGLLVFSILAACASRTEAIPSAISCRMATKVMAGVSDVDVLLGGIYQHIQDDTE
uniref:Uncharacterized protein n=1 Tax=Tanacetum cinerariifolium TaxID=118510 RepID=A0A6L2NIM2_TANCI|nr:hypothetical protein [Tanacetum cinerariifolium]